MIKKIQGYLTTLYMVLFQSSFVILCSIYAIYKNLGVIGPQWVKRQMPV